MTEPTKEALWIALCEKDGSDPKIGRAMIYRDEFFAALYAFAALRVVEAEANAREKVAVLMLRNGIATGHGDTVEDLLAELEAVIRDIKEPRR